MARFVIFLIPILINYSAGGIFFITAHRLAEAGANRMLITATSALWALLYAGASLGVGKITTPKNAYKMILGSFLGFCIVGLGFLLLSDLYLQFLWIAIGGVVMSFYCTPFQVYMKGFEKKENSGVVASTCKYDASWSFGLATGAFVFGSLGWRTGYVLIISAAVFMFFGLVMIERKRQRQPGTYDCSDQAVESGNQSVDAPVMPDCVVPIWWLGGCGTLVIAIVRTLEPALAVQLGISAGHAGTILAMVSLTQVAVALLLIRCTKWYYCWKSIILVGIAGCIGLLLFAFGKHCAVLYVAALIYGIHSGLFYLLFVYHALIHPEKSGQYVSVNEAIVGGTTVGGCLLGGVIAQCYDYQTVFAVSAAIVLLSALPVAWVIRRKIQRGRDLKGI